MNYKNLLQQKVDQAREQIQADQYRSNEELAAELANHANPTLLPMLMNGQVNVA